jgi:PAS domain S-box-containing protein
VTTDIEAPSTNRSLEPASQADWWYTPLLEHTHEAIIIWELGGKGILYWNPAAELLYGYRLEEVRGRITHEVLATEVLGSIPQLENAIAHHGIWTGALRHRTRMGWRITVQSRLVLLPRVDERWLVAEFNLAIDSR